MSQKPLFIFISGPYAGKNIVENVREALFRGDKVAKLGHYPFIPQLRYFWEFLVPHAKEFWASQNIAWILKCDAVLRIPGESEVADNEVNFAIENGKKVYYSLLDIPRAS
jgi:hypothetical protein